jgi:hypothetical protein
MVQGAQTNDVVSDTCRQHYHANWSVEQLELCENTAEHRESL